MFSRVPPDLTISCPDGRQLKCHRAILAAGSKRFASVFQQADLTGTQLPVQGVDSDALETIVRSFYSGECPITTSSVCPLYDAACKLEVAQVVAACQQFVQNLSVSAAVTVLEQALQQDNTKVLVQSCLDGIVSRFEELPNSPTFLATSFDVALRVIKDNAQRHPNYVLAAAAAWLQHSPAARSEHRTQLLQAAGLMEAASGLGTALRTTAGPPSVAEASERGNVRDCGVLPTVLDKQPAAGLVSGAAPPQASVEPSGLRPYPGKDLGISGHGGSIVAPAVPGFTAALPLFTGGPTSTSLAQLAQLQQLSGLLSGGNGGSLLPFLSGLPLQNFVPGLLQLQGLIPPQHAAQPLAPTQAQAEGLHQAGQLRIAALGTAQPSSIAHSAQALATATSTVNTLGTPAGLLPPGHLLQVPAALAALSQPSLLPLLAVASAQNPTINTASLGGIHALKGLAGGSSLPAGMSLPPRPALAQQGNLPVSLIQKQLGQETPAAPCGLLGTAKQEACTLGRPSSPAAQDGNSSGAGQAGSQWPLGIPTLQRKRKRIQANPRRSSGIIESESARLSQMYDASPALTMAVQLLLGSMAISSGSNNSAAMEASDKRWQDGAALCAGPDVAELTKPACQEDQLDGLNAGTSGASCAETNSRERATSVSTGQRPAVGLNPENTDGKEHLDTEPCASKLGPWRGLVVNPATGASHGALREVDRTGYMGREIPNADLASELVLPGPPVIKGICHVENCYADLTNLREYHLRYKICDYHFKASSIFKDGVPQRFCQQCGRFHSLDAFDGTKRSCRRMLERHNERRAKKVTVERQQGTERRD